MKACVRMAIAGALASSLLTSCGGGGGTPSSSISGSVSGLVGSGLVLANSNGDSVSISANGPFSFQVPLPVGTAYHITVASVPDTNPKQRCTVSNGNGSSTGAPINDVSVTCIGPLVYLPAVNFDYNHDDTGYPVIYAYTMHVDTGALSPVTDSPFAVGGFGGNALRVDGTGHFAYLAVTGTSVYGYAIEQGTGALEALPGSPYQFGSGSMQLDPTGRFAYAGLTGLTTPESAIAVAAIDSSTGALVPTAGSPFAVEAGGPTGLSFSSDGRFLYATSNAATVNGSNRSGEIYGFEIDSSTGALTPLPGGPLVTADSTSDVILDPKGRFVYVQENDAIWAYAIDATTGALSPVGGSPFTVNVNAALGTAATIDPEGRFLMTSQGVYDFEPPNSQAGLWAYAINSMTGALTQVSGDPFLTTGNPQTPVYFDLGGNFAYSMDVFDGAIAGYSISPTSGVLTPIAGSPFATAAIGLQGTMTFDPSGRFAYVQGGQYKGAGGSLSVSALDHSTGALTLVSYNDDLSSAVPAELTIVPVD